MRRCRLFLGRVPNYDVVYHLVEGIYVGSCETLDQARCIASWLALKNQAEFGVFSASVTHQYFWEMAHHVYYREKDVT